MKKLLLLLAITFTIVMIGCKKDKETIPIKDYYNNNYSGGYNCIENGSGYIPYSWYSNISKNISTNKFNLQFRNNFMWLMNPINYRIDFTLICKLDSNENFEIDTLPVHCIFNQTVEYLSFSGYGNFYTENDTIKIKIHLSDGSNILLVKD